MHVTREFYQVYKLWLVIAEEYEMQDSEELEMLAQWVFNAQEEKKR